MGYTVIKAVHEPSDDRYLIWSSIVDAPLLMGSKEDVADWWRAEFGRAGMTNLANDLYRVDRYGSSSPTGSGRWDHDLIWQQEGILPRHQVGEVCQRWAEARSSGEVDLTALVADLLVPFPVEG